MVVQINSPLGSRGLTDAVEGFFDTRQQIQAMQEHQKTSAMKRAEIQSRIGEATQRMDITEAERVRNDFEFLTSFMDSDMAVGEDPAGMAMADRLAANLDIDPELLYNWVPNETTFEDLMRDELMGAWEHMAPEMQERILESASLTAWGAETPAEEFFARASQAEMNSMMVNLGLAYARGEVPDDQSRYARMARSMLGIGEEPVRISVGGVELDLAPDTAAQVILSQLKMDMEWHMMSRGEQRDIAREYTELLNQNNIGIAEHNVRQLLNLHGQLSQAESPEEEQRIMGQIEEFRNQSEIHLAASDFVTKGIDLSMDAQERLMRSSPEGALFADFLRMAEQHEQLGPFLESHEGRKSLSPVMEAATGFRLRRNVWGWTTEDPEIGPSRDPANFAEFGGEIWNIDEFVSTVAQAVSRGEALRAELSGEELRAAVEADPNAMLMEEVGQIPGMTNEIRTEIAKQFRRQGR